MILDGCRKMYFVQYIYLCSCGCVQGFIFVQQLFLFNLTVDNMKCLLKIHNMFLLESDFMQVNMAQNPGAHICWHAANLFIYFQTDCVCVQHIGGVELQVWCDIWTQLFLYATQTKFLPCANSHSCPALTGGNNMWGEEQNKEKKTWLSSLIPS